MGVCPTDLFRSLLCCLPQNPKDLAAHVSSLSSSPNSLIFFPPLCSPSGGDVDEERVPKNPPFTAYLGNLPYEINEEDIKRFFSKMTVKNVRIPKEGGDSGRVKGFAYAEFSTRQELIDGLSMNNEVKDWMRCVCAVVCCL